MDLTELLKKHLFTSRSLLPGHFQLTLNIFLGGNLQMAQAQLWLLMIFRS